MALGIAAAIGGSLLGGAISSRGARKAASTLGRGYQRAFEAFRSPEETLAQAYDTGIYGDETMDAILAKESELIPRFQELAEQRARGIRGIQEESKLRQLGLLGQYGDQIRSTLQDPRLAAIADADLEAANRLSAQAANPLQGQRAMEAEQSALETSLRQGRILDKSAQANVILGRQAAKSALDREAGAARTRALQSAQRASVDPYTFLFNPSAEESIFTQAGLQPQVTDPGYAFNLGRMEDQRKAEMILGKAQAYATGKAASANILGNTVGSIGTMIGSAMAKPSIPSMGGGMNVQNAMQQQFLSPISNLQSNITGLNNQINQALLGNFRP